MEYFNVSGVAFQTMITYLSLFLIPILATILPIKFKSNTNYNLMICFALICTFLIGFRYQVGGDWGVYEKYIIGANAVNFQAMLNTKDPGYMSFLWLSSYLGLGQIGINLFCASIFMYGVHRLCTKQPYPWLAYLVAFPYLITVVGFGYTRQSLAIGLLFLIYSLWQEAKKNYKIKIILIILLGSLFHKSLLLFLPIIFIEKKGFLINKKILLLSLPVIIFLAYYYSIYLQQIWKFYVVQSQLHTTIANAKNLSISYGSSIRSYMNIPACILFFIFFKKFYYFNDRRLLAIASIFSIVFVFMTPFASTLLDRLGLYLIFFQIIVYSRIPSFIKDKYVSLLYVYGLTFFHILVFFVWFNYSYSSIAWKPYQLTLFKPTYYINSWILSDEMLNFNIKKSIQNLEEYKKFISEYGEEGMKTYDVNNLYKKNKKFAY